MLATPTGYYGVDVGTIRREGKADLVGVEHEEAGMTVLRLGVTGVANLLREEGGGSPEGAGKDAGGVGGGEHGMDTVLVEGGRDILGFIDDEEGGGGSADDAGGGVPGEEGDTSLIDAADVAAMLAPAMGKEGVVLKKLIEAEEGVESLRFVGGVDKDDAGGEGREEVEKVGGEVEEELVLAGLAREDDDDGVAELVGDGVEEAGEGGDLVGTQAEPGGGADEFGQAGEEGGEVRGVGVHGLGSFLR